MSRGSSVAWRGTTELVPARSSGILTIIILLVPARSSGRAKNRTSGRAKGDRFENNRGKGYI